MPYSCLRYSFMLHANIYDQRLNYDPEVHRDTQLQTTLHDSTLPACV
jgi:hypothetical protein